MGVLNTTTDNKAIQSHALAGSADRQAVGQIAEDIKAGWQPKVNLKGATQPGVKLWKKLWE
jgi:hypothetical protein